MKEFLFNPKLFFLVIKILIYFSLSLVCMCLWVFEPHSHDRSSEADEASNPLPLELWTVVSYHINTRNGNQVLCKSNLYS